MDEQNPTQSGLNIEVPETDLQLPKGDVTSDVKLNSGTDNNVDVEQQAFDMDELSVSNPVKYLATYNSPHEWILDQREAETAQMIRDTAMPEQASKVGALAYSAGELKRKTGNMARDFSEYAAGVDAYLLPNADKDIAERAYKNMKKLSVQTENNRADYVSLHGVDPDVYGIGTNVMEVARDMVLTAGVAGAVRRGATKAAYGYAASRLAPSATGVAERFAAQQGKKAASRAAMGTIAGETFMREAGDRATQQAAQYMDATGDYDLKYYDPTVDLALNTGVSAINSAIEMSLGIERIVPDMLFGTRGAGRIAEEFVRGYISERSEEFLQNIFDQGGDVLSGYRENIDLFQAWNDSAAAGWIGGIFGSGTAAGMYYLNRRRMIRQLEEGGIEKETATKFVDKYLQDGINKTLSNMSSTVELRTKDGPAYDKLKAGIKNALVLQGWNEKMIDPQTGKPMNIDAYVDTLVTKDFINRAVTEALTSGVSIDDWLDVAQFTAIDNVLYVRPLGTAEDIQKRIDEADAVIKRQLDLKKTGAENAALLQEARSQKAVLRKLKANKILDSEIERVSIQEAKTPEIQKEIDTATSDADTLGKANSAADFVGGLENMTDEEKTRRLGNALLKRIFGNDTRGFDAIMTKPEYANVRAAINSSAAKIFDYLKNHRAYGIAKDLRDALKMLPNVKSGNFINVVTTPDLTGEDPVARNAFLYNFVFNDANTTAAFIDAYLTRAEESITNQTKVRLGKKDIVGQAFKAMDSLMQTQADVAGLQYNSIYNEDGSVADPNVAAVVASWQNLFVEVPAQQLYQTGYASMRGELVGEYIDANLFAHTGEGPNVHSWGNYFLASEKIDYDRYYKKFEREGPALKYDGKEVDDLVLRGLDIVHPDVTRLIKDKLGDLSVTKKMIMDTINRQIVRDTNIYKYNMDTVLEHLKNFNNIDEEKARKIIADMEKMLTKKGGAFMSLLKPFSPVAYPEVAKIQKKYLKKGSLTQFEDDYVTIYNELMSTFGIARIQPYESRFAEMFSSLRELKRSAEAVKKLEFDKFTGRTGLLYKGEDFYEWLEHKLRVSESRHGAWVADVHRYNIRGKIIKAVQDAFVHNTTIDEQLNKIEDKEIKPWLDIKPQLKSIIEQNIEKEKSRFPGADTKAVKKFLFDFIDKPDLEKWPTDGMVYQDWYKDESTPADRALIDAVSSPQNNTIKTPNGETDILIGTINRVREAGARKRLFDAAKNALKNAKKEDFLYRPSASMYRTDNIPENPELLDMSKRLTRQPKNIQKALRRFVGENQEIIPWLKDLYEVGFADYDMTGTSTEIFPEYAISDLFALDIDPTTHVSPKIMSIADMMKSDKYKGKPEEVKRRMIGVATDATVNAMLKHPDRQVTLDDIAKELDILKGYGDVWGSGLNLTPGEKLINKDFGQLVDWLKKGLFAYDRKGTTEANTISKWMDVSRVEEKGIRGDDLYERLKGWLYNHQPIVEKYYKSDASLGLTKDPSTIEILSKLWLKQGIRGVRYYGGTDKLGFVTFEPTKPTQRLYQLAYAGARVDYDQPSLQAIGTGEQNQAHGYGLYYALNPEIAEKYRQNFTSDYRHVTLYKGEEVDILKEDTPHDQALSDLVRDYSSIKDTDMSVRKQKFIKKYEDEIASTKQYVKENEDRMKQETIRDSSRTLFDFYQEKIKHDEAMLDAFKNIDATQIKEKKWGQVHEVDIPENEELLDEQKMLIDQPQYVEDIIWKINKDLDLGIVDSGITGDRIYQKISDKLGSDKAASELLDKYGIKGITYFGREDGRCFVIFNDKYVKVLRKKFDELGNQLFALDFQSPEPLVATHAISKEGMERALEVGGFAMPSLAITKDIDENSYGDIVFVAPASMAQPSRNTRVYDRDAWTPMIDFIEYTAKEGFADRVKDILPPGADWSMFVSNIEDKANSWPEDNIMAKQLFAIYKGFPESEVPFIQRKFDEDNDLRKEYLQWYQDFVMSNMQGRIFRGFTPSGTRRYAPVTLDNIVRELKTQPEHKDFSYYDFYGFHDVARELVTRFKSPKDIKKEQGRIQDTVKVHDQEAELQTDFYSLASELNTQKDVTSRANSHFALANALLDTEGSLAERLERYGFKNDAESVKAVEGIIEKIKKMPVRYFEVKTQRAIRFNEFSAVFVPSKQSYDEIAERLTEQGANVLRYGSKEERAAMFDELVNGDDTIMFQGRRGKINGVFDPELGTILVGKNFNGTTLPHEMAHYWLDTIFKMFKRVQAGEIEARPEWVAQKREMFAMLGINENQTSLTRGQQEKFATMLEAYISGVGVTNEITRTFNDYLKWVPEKYRNLQQLSYIDENGKIQNVFLDAKAVEFFNKWYENPTLPSLSTSPERQRFMNVTGDDGNVIRVSIKEINDREKEFAQDAEEQLHTDQRMYNTLDENMPADIKSVADAQKVSIAARSNFLKTTEETQKKIITPDEDRKRRWFERKSRETEAQLAQDYIEKNPDHAHEVIFGDPELIPNDTGIDRATLINTYMALNNVAESDPDWARLQTNIAINQSLAGTQLALSNDKSYRVYLDGLREIEDVLEMKAATNYAGSAVGARERFNADIQQFLSKELPAVFATEAGSDEREIALKKMFEKARTIFSGNTTGQFLTQMDMDYAKAQKRNTDAFVKWAEKVIKTQAGAKLNAEQQAHLLKISAKAQQALQDIDNKDAGVAVAGALELRNWQLEKQKLMGVAPKKFSLFGDYAPRAMLASPNTLLFANIPSTAINTLVTNVAKRGELFGENKVSDKLISDEIKRIKKIYGATAMNLAQMEKPTSPSLLHGEKYSAAGQKWYDPYTILGREDNLFRVPTFVNTLARIASKDAKATGRSADEVFLEYIKLNDQSDSAKLARKQALAVANMAVFTQNGALARCLNHIRSELNYLSRVPFGLDPHGFGVGSLIAPFLSTGANIAEMGIRGAIAPIATLTTYAQALRTGKAIDPLKKLALRMDWTYFVFSAVSMALLAALTSDDDEFYIDPYKTGMGYDPDRPYDSINIGGVWVDLDFFGPFSIPMRTAAKVIQAWKKDNGIGTALLSGYSESAKSVLGDIPLAESLINNQFEWAMKKPGAFAGSYAYNQANKLVPAGIKPISRALSRGQGWMLRPFEGTTVGRKFNRNYGFDGQELTSQDLLEMFTIKFQLGKEAQQYVDSILGLQ